jgi:hypothetical protein
LRCKLAACPERSDAGLSLPSRLVGFRQARLDFAQGRSFLIESLDAITKIKDIVGKTALIHAAKNK